MMKVLCLVRVRTKGKALCTTLKTMVFAALLGVAGSLGAGVVP